jgi:hypothetical protein
MFHLEGGVEEDHIDLDAGKGQERVLNPEVNHGGEREAGEGTKGATREEKRIRREVTLVQSSNAEI